MSRVRKNSGLLVGLGLLILSLLSGCANGTLIMVEATPGAPGATVEAVEAVEETAVDLPRWEPGVCRFTITIAETVECGDLIVPEDRRPESDPNRTISLHVAIVQSHSADPQPDPVIYLSGGPGQETLTYFNQIVPRFAEILDERALILFDQRGIGYSDPSLACPEASDWEQANLVSQLSRAEVVAGSVEASLACHERLLADGVNLEAYTSAENAADVDALRQALGYEQANLYGVSYGTRLALTVMRDFGQDGTLRSAILDSVFPPQVDFYAELAPDGDRIFNLLFESCAADADCRAAYPNLETTFYDLVDRLSAEPIIVDVARPTGGPYKKLLDGDDIVDVVFTMLYDSASLPLVPKFIDQMSRDDFSDSTLQFWLRWLSISNEYSSQAMWYSVMCGEEADFTSEAVVRQAGGDLRSAVQGYFIDLATVADLTVCQDWGARPAAPLENEPVVSDVPALILSGEFDPITPPVWNQLAAETLSQSTLVEFPGIAHGVFRASDCARAITTAFVADPSAAPNTDCLADEPSLAFEAEAPTGPLVTAGSSAVNLRLGPGVNYEAAGLLQPGERLPITGRNADTSWWQVETPDGLRWIAAGVTTAINIDTVAVADAPPAPTAVAAIPALPTATPVPPPAAPPPGSPPPAPANAAFDYGIQVDPDGDAGLNVRHIQEIGFHWVKLQMPWNEVEPGPGDYQWHNWDGKIDAYHNAGFKVLLSIPKAPVWARPADDDKSVEGPPSDPQTYARFVATITARYKGRVQAIEVWNEQNLYYEAGGQGRVNVDTYMTLLRAAYGAIKAVDPGMVVVSGALTPTGAPPPLAVDDVLYLRQMYERGLKDVSDAVGAHPSGFANSPEILYPGGDYDPNRGYDDHRSFFFRNTMEEYRKVMVEFGDADKLIWVTEFGWPVWRYWGDARFEFAKDNNLDNQAWYTVRAYEMGKAWGWVGPMFLWNLDYALTTPQSEMANFGIITKDAVMPVFQALQTMPK